MIQIKTADDIEKLREGGRRLATVVSEVAKMAVPGASTYDLDQHARKLIEDGGDTSAFFNFTPYGASRPYPATICISVNDEIVHGIPNEEPKIIEEGDVVGIDCGLIHNKMFTDHAVTIGVGEISKEAQKLLTVTREAMLRGIKEAKPGNHTGDIGAVIEQHAKKHDIKIIKGLCGHGVGYDVHEDPYVPNYGRRGEGDKLVAGMVIAIEPIFSLGATEFKVAKDGYTYLTEDGSLAAQFEHTVAITENGPEILTKI